MRRLAAQRSVLHPKATLLLQNIINEPSQQVPVERIKNNRKKLVIMYVQCKSACMRQCVCVSVQKHKAHTET